MEKISHPDIIVTSQDGEYLMIVEVKPNDVSKQRQYAMNQLQRSMIDFGCSVGLLVAGERVTVLRDSFDDSHGSSIYVVGEATLPHSFLTTADEQWRGNTHLEFE
ncbi:MAG: hypothetical protein ACK48B_04200 [Dolichospermum sp.]